MFAKTNVIECCINNLMLLIYLLQILPQLCLLRQMDRLLDKKPDAFNAFIRIISNSIMFAKTNGSNVVLTI